MRRKEVVLDFTSLLDIILIILFFFILFSAFNVKEYEARAEEAQAAYEDKLDALEAEKKGLDADRDRLQAREEELRAEWDRLLALDENAARNQQALIAFNSGGMLSFNLQKEDASDDWELRAIRRNSAAEEESVVGVIRPGEPLFEAMLAILDRAGFDEDDVVIVTFTYNGNGIGTHRLYVQIMQAFRELQELRKNVYLNAINISK